MQSRDVLGFVLVPLVLLATAWLVDSYKLWSFLANLTLPWLCTALAVSVLILGAVCVVLQVPPSAVPKGKAALVVIGVLAIFGVGMYVDRVTYAEAPDEMASLAEWIGLAIILSGVFVLSRRRLSPAA